MNKRSLTIMTLAILITAIIFFQFSIIQAAEAENSVNVTLYANNYGYNSTKGGPEIKAIVGDKIIIHLIGNGTGPARHNFVLDKESPSPYEVSSERLSNGEKDEIIFIANKAGKFQYYCNVSPPYGDSHRDKGQQGIINIMEKDETSDSSYQVEPNYQVNSSKQETEKEKTVYQLYLIEEIIGTKSKRSSQILVGAIIIIGTIIIIGRDYYIKRSKN